MCCHDCNNLLSVSYRGDFIIVLRRSHGGVGVYRAKPFLALEWLSNA